MVCMGSYFIFIILLPLVMYFYSLRNYFLKTNRELKRLEALSRSPVYSHLSETLDGLVTIRSLSRTDIFLDMNKRLVNQNCRSFFAFVAGSRWLGFRLDIIVLLLLAASTFGAVACFDNGVDVDPNLLAVGIMYVIQLTGLFQWCVRQSAEVESQMVSVERVLQYSALDSEPALHGPANVGALDTRELTDNSTEKGANSISAGAVELVPLSTTTEAMVAAADTSDITVHRPHWPEYGGVEVTNLTVTYRHDLAPVLKSLTFSISPGSRVGCVGRTGAGKSTLVGAFLRLVEKVPGSGTIRIDGLDIDQVGLHDLRPRISVIPQTPFLFSGKTSSSPSSPSPSSSLLLLSLVLL